jgi:hypothetical protein
MSVQQAVPKRIKPEDLEAKFRELKGDVEEEARGYRNYAIAAGVAVVVAVVAVSFLLGKRRGRKKNTFIEIRRV